MRYKFTDDTRESVAITLLAGESVSASTDFFEAMDASVSANAFAGGLTRLVKRAFSGESTNNNVYTTKTGGKVVLKAQPGFVLRAVEVDPDNYLVVEKRQLVALGPGLEAETIIVHKLMESVYGKQGFVLLRITGKGTAFIQARGTCAKHSIHEGKIITVQLTSFVGFQKRVMLDFNRKGSNYTVDIDGNGVVYLQESVESQQKSSEESEPALELPAQSDEDGENSEGEHTGEASENA